MNAHRSRAGSPISLRARGRPQLPLALLLEARMTAALTGCLSHLALIGLLIRSRKAARPRPSEKKGEGGTTLTLGWRGAAQAAIAVRRCV